MPKNRSEYPKGKGTAGHTTLQFCLFIKREAEMVVSIAEESLFWAQLYAYQIFSWRN
jgi:hypothetical protein